MEQMRTAIGRRDTAINSGAFGQYCIVMPEQDAVLAITGGMDVFEMQAPLNLVWEMLLPAMRPDSLPDDVAAQDSLTKKLSSLCILPVQGGVSSPISGRVSGRTYKVDANELTIDTIGLTLSESGCAVRIKTAAAEETITCKYGVWQAGQTALFTGSRLSGSQRIVASGAW